VAELAIRTIDCGFVAMAAAGYGGPSPMGLTFPIHVYVTFLVVRPVPFCTAWWQRHLCMNSLLSVVTWQVEWPRVEAHSLQFPCTDKPLVQRLEDW